MKQAVNLKDICKLAVPALVYSIQGNLMFLALSNLDAAVYQVNKFRMMQRPVYPTLPRLKVSVYSPLACFG